MSNNNQKGRKKTHLKTLTTVQNTADYTGMHIIPRPTL